MKLQKIFADVIKAHLSDKTVLIGDLGEGYVAVSPDGYVCYVMEDKNFLLDKKKLLGTRQEFCMNNIFDRKALDEARPAKWDGMIRVNAKGEKVYKIVNDDTYVWVDSKLLRHFDDPEYQILDPKRPVFIYEHKHLVGMVMPMNIKEVL